MQTAQENARDLVLPPGSYAYVQTESSGAIKIHVGPHTVTVSGQERPVKYDPANRNFFRCGQEDAVCPFVFAAEGDYIVLENPHKEGNYPPISTASPSPEAGQIEMGKRVVIPGPVSFPLWPCQSAEVIEGHELASNEYLLVSVYNEDEARQNWKEAISAVNPVIKTDGDGDGDGEEDDTKPALVAVTDIRADELKMGQVLVIRGNEVAFYIPPTGIEVLVDAEDNYIREAVTLERLEYCILVDEDGEKRYERGPAVVFPKPTENFIEDVGHLRKFKAIELPKMAGVHIKVIADYDNHKIGEELFISGAEQSIYFPRIEHSIIRYGDLDIHYAVAIPLGEGRYVLNRNAGEIRTANGPEMLLVDPRDEVIIRRILSPKQADLWYPGNIEAAEYNERLAEASSALERTGGYVDEASYAKSLRSLGAPKRRKRQIAAGSSTMDFEATSDEMLADEFKRGEKFTPPRTVTLDTKYDGVPAINVFTGYAVLVISKSGERKVHEGPCNILLDYDQTLEILELSTGKPKNTDNKKKTVYLRTRNNKVSDIVAVETSDHAQVNVKISLLVNFEGENDNWFHAENYVKLLSDHVRSVLKGMVQKIDIETFYANHVAIIRDAILGKSAEGGRKGMVFKENGMVVKDVEILGFEIRDKEISSLLSGAQYDAVKTNVDLQNARRRMETKLKVEEINRKTHEAAHVTHLHDMSLASDNIIKKSENDIAQIQADLVYANERQKANEAQEAAANVEHAANLKREKEEKDQKHEFEQKEADLFMKKLEAEIEAAVKRFNAGQGAFSEALLALNRDDVMMKVAEATSVASMIGGKSFVDVFQQIFKDTPIAEMARKFAGKLPASEEAALSGSFNKE